MPSPYRHHLAFIDAARRTPDLPRLVFGVVAVEFLYNVFMRLFDALLSAFPEAAADAVYFGSSPVGLLVQLFSFGFLAAAVILVARLLHFRTAFTLTGPPDAAWSLGKQVFWACVGVFLAVELLPPHWSSYGAEFRPFGSWLLLVPFALAALLVQTAAEEVLYRGYIQQQLAVRFSSPLIWMIVPNLLFAAAHWTGSDGGEAWGYVIWAFFFGLFASDLTARTGSLGPAIGLHLANNFYAFMFFAEKGAADSGLALILFPATEDLLPPSSGATPIVTLDLVIELTLLLLMWLAARIAIRR